MENMDFIVTILSNFGFPIVCCGVLMWYVFNLQKQHKEEVEKMVEALNQNTIAIQRLIDKIGE